jgi:hypothetical protein
VPQNYSAGSTLPISNVSEIISTLQVHKISGARCSPNLGPELVREKLNVIIEPARGRCYDHNV